MANTGLVKIELHPFFARPSSSDNGKNRDIFFSFFSFFAWKGQKVMRNRTEKKRNRRRKRERERIREGKRREEKIAQREHTRYLSPREPVAVFEMSAEFAAGLTLRGGRAGAGAWLEDEVETGPMTPTLPPRTPSSAECCLEDCELCDNQRRPPPLVTTVDTLDPVAWWDTTTVPPLSSDVLCDQKFKSAEFARSRWAGRDGGIDFNF